MERTMSSRMLHCAALAAAVLLVSWTLAGCASHTRGVDEVVTRLGQGPPLHIVGINTEHLDRVCPGGHTSCAEEAANYTASLVDSTPLTLEIPAPGFPDRDRDGQLLRYVRLSDGRDLGAELIRAGYATADLSLKHPRLEQYKQIEAEARDAGRGIWAAAGRDE